jgi:hypothetical protein
VETLPERTPGRLDRPFRTMDLVSHGSACTRASAQVLMGEQYDANAGSFSITLGGNHLDCLAHATCAHTRTFYLPLYPDLLRSYKCRFVSHGVRERRNFRSTGESREDVWSKKDSIRVGGAE